MRLAWFSPLPPSHSGIAAYSAELLPCLAPTHQVDRFVDRPPQPGEAGVWSAHDFVWKHRRQPYDLTVYQLGNASCHDYMWAYLFRYPGLVVLHDAQLHQARALFLTGRWQPRTADYLTEFAANHPEAPADIGQLVAAGVGGTLYHHWPLIRLVVESARLTLVHNRRLMVDLRERHPAAAIEAIEMGVDDPRAATGTVDVRRRHGIPADALILSAFGGITPEKRIPALLAAVGALRTSRPDLHVLLVGAASGHYDVEADVAAHGLSGRVHVAGFVADADLPAYLAATDVAVCLRWPTNRETSASWLRCLGAGLTTIVSDLTHLADVPTLDPRDWRLLDASADKGSPRSHEEHEENRHSFPLRDLRDLRGDLWAARQSPPIAVSIDVLDEAHSLQLALDRLAADRTLRLRLGRAARDWWETHHRLDAMAAAYETMLARAAAAPAPTPRLPAHLTDDGAAKAHALVAPFGLPDVLA